MDIQAIIDQVLETAGSAPDKIGELLQDPQAAIEEITGQALGEGEVSQVIDGVKERIADGGFDLGGIDLGNLDLGNLDLSALGGLGGIGEALGDSPLGGIGNMLGGFFGKK